MRRRHHTFQFLVFTFQFVCVADTTLFPFQLIKEAFPEGNASQKRLLITNFSLLTTKERSVGTIRMHRYRCRNRVGQPILSRRLVREGCSQAVRLRPNDPERT